VHHAVAARGLRRVPGHSDRRRRGCVSQCHAPCLTAGALCNLCTPTHATACCCVYWLTWL
jgi:hypothetical protein